MDLSLLRGHEVGQLQGAPGDIEALLVVATVGVQGMGVWISQNCRLRCPSSSPSRFCSRVVPVRGNPSTKMGRSTLAEASSGCRLRWSWMRRRFDIAFTIVCSVSSVPSDDSGWLGSTSSSFW